MRVRDPSAEGRTDQMCECMCMDAFAARLHLVCGFNLYRLQTLRPFVHITVNVTHACACTPLRDNVVRYKDMRHAHTRYSVLEHTATDP